MKRVAALISPKNLDAVHSELQRRGVDDLTVTEVIESGTDERLVSTYRGAAYATDMVPRLRLELVTTDVQARPIAYTIADLAPGDGAVVIHPVEEPVFSDSNEGEPAPTRGSHAPIPAPRPATSLAISDWTKVLISNVFLATTVLTLVFHAPLGSAALGGAGGGLAMWGLARLNALRRRA